MENGQQFERVKGIRQSEKEWQLGTMALSQ